MEAVWWNGKARRQRADHEHSASPLAAFQKEFMRKNSSSSRIVSRGWEDMIVPGRENPRKVGQSEWDEKIGMIDCVFHCMIGWNDIYLPRGLLNIYSSLHSLSLSPLHLCMSPLPSPSPSYLFLRTPAIAQSSAKLSGCGGSEKWNFLPEWVLDFAGKF